MVGSNYTDELRVAGLTTPGQLAQAVGRHVRHRRADREGPPVVLRHGARRGAAPDDSERLPEPERRRSDQVSVRARSDPRGARRRELAALQRPRDVSGHAARQDQLALGRAAAVQRVDVHHAPAMGAAISRSPEPSIGPLGLGGSDLDDVARDRRVPRCPPARAAADLVGRRRRTACCSRPASAPIRRRSAPYESPGNTTRGLARVTEQCAAGCSANGGIPNLTYRSANWGRQLGRAVHVARLGLVRDRRPQPQDRLRRRRAGLGSARTTPTISTWPTRLNNGVPNSADAEPAAVHDQLSDPQRVVLRAGPVDARPHDAAGRAALRPQLELLARADDRRRRPSCRRRSSSRKRRA